MKKAVEDIFIFSYFPCEAGLTVIVVLHAKTITIKYAGGVSHESANVKNAPF